MKLVRDTIWMLISNFVVVVLSVLQYLVLLRLYDFSPKVFGIYQYIISLVLTTIAFSFLSMHNAFVAERTEHDENQRRQFASWFLIIPSILGFIVLTTVAIFRGSPMWMLLAGISIFFSDTIYYSYYSLARDAKNFKRIAVTLSVQSMVRIIIAIALGYFVRNVAALAVGYIFADIVAIFLLYDKVKIVPCIPKFGFLKNFVHSNKEIVIFQTMSNLLSTFSYNLPVFMIENIFGTLVLGFYSLAYRTLLTANRVFSQVVIQTFLPYMSKSEKDEKNILQRFHYLALLLFPVYFLIGSLSDYYVPFIFGAKNSDIIPIIKIIIPWMFAVAVCSPAKSTYLVHKKNLELLIINILLLASRYLSFVLFKNGGLHTTLIVFSIASVFFFILILVRSYFFAKVNFLKGFSIIAAMEIVLFLSMLDKKYLSLGYAAMLLTSFFAIRIGIRMIKKNGLNIFK